MVSFEKIVKVCFSVFIVLSFVSCSGDKKTDVTDDLSDDLSDEVLTESDETVDEVADLTVDEIETPDETVDETADETIIDEEIDEEADEDTFVPYDPRVAPALCGINEYNWLKQDELPMGTGLGFVLESKELLTDLEGIAARKKAALITLMETNDEVKSRNIVRRPKHDVRIFKIRY